MILGEMNSRQLYYGVHPRMKAAFDFLEQCFAKGVEPGRYEIDGADLYAMVFRYVPQEKEEQCYESHDQYIDIQCMAAGSEYQWYHPRWKLTESAHYNPGQDVTFYPFEGVGSRLHLQPGEFAVYFPQDAHLPCVADGTAEECMRIVVKVRV